MPKSQQSWDRSQHPPAQWNLRGGRLKQCWIQYIENKLKKSPCKFMYLLVPVAVPDSVPALDSWPCCSSAFFSERNAFLKIFVVINPSSKLTLGTCRIHFFLELFVFCLESGLRSRCRFLTVTVSWPCPPSSARSSPGGPALRSSSESQPWYT